MSGLGAGDRRRRSFEDDLGDAPPNAGEEVPMEEARRASERLERKRQWEATGKQQGEASPNRQAQLELLMIIAAAALGFLAGFLCFPDWSGATARRRQDRAEEQMV